jgi:Icc-related predicted phosphoesterase
MSTMVTTDSISFHGAAVRVIVFGDTHEHHRDVSVPDGNLLIHVGDITRNSFSPRAIQDFDAWLRHLPHQYKIVIPGNHDYGLADPAWQKLITSAILLINNGVELMGLKIWGTPITPVDHGHFGGETAADRERQFRRIPDETNIIISHGPPHGILDCEPGGAIPQGCRELLRAVKRINPLLNAFGHIHGASGVVQSGKTLFVNAAVAGRNGYPVRKPRLICVSRSARESCT